MGYKGVGYKGVGMWVWGLGRRRGVKGNGYVVMGHRQEEKV